MRIILEYVSTGKAFSDFEDDEDYDDEEYDEDD